MSYHGQPVWFELATAQGALAQAGGFYEKILGWQVADSGMEGFTYHLAKSGDDMVAGLMEMPSDVSGVPPLWTVYFAVDDADAAAARISELGGTIHRTPADIPGTGRFAIAADPQGAGFGILCPLPMDPSPPEGSGAWNQQKAGRGNWIELMSTDPVAGFDFYAALLGWQKGEAMDMGEMGSYQLFHHKGTDIGGMMGLGNAPVPCWLAYFGVDDLAATLDAIKVAGGSVVSGPHEVPGPALIAVAQDPQGAHFAVVGPKP